VTTTRTPQDRYAAVAVILHWAIAIAIIGNVLIGWWMHEAIDAPETRARAFVAFQLHKSIGLSVLLLSVARLAWRFANPPPPLPAAMPGWERIAAQATHWAFYVLMIALPLSGWVYASTMWSDGRPLLVQTQYFGLFPVPNLFGLDAAPAEVRAQASAASVAAHKALAWTMVGLLALHVGAALKHQVIDRDDVLGRMVPALGAGATPRRAIALAGGFAVIAAACVAVIIALTAPMPRAAPEAPAAAAIVEDAPDAAVQEEIAAQMADTAAPPAPPPVWTIDAAASSMSFTASLSGAPLRGRFPRWRGEIRYDPADPSTAQARFAIETGATTIGAPELQASLVSEEGFNPGAFPEATFTLASLRVRGPGAFTARGALRLKGRTLQLAIPVTLSIEGGRAQANARFTLQRDAVDLGMVSDPDYEFIDRDVVVDATIVAAR